MNRAVWASQFDTDETKVLVWRNGELLWGRVASDDPDQIEARVGASSEPKTLLGSSAIRFRPDQVAKLAAGSGGDVDLHVRSNGTTEQLKGFFGPGGMEIYELLRTLRPDMKVASKVENPIVAAVKPLGIGLFLAACFGVLYVLIAQNLVNRAHWLIAFVVNTIGPLPLLIVAIVCAALGVLGAMVCFARPQQIWTLQETR
ncbi:MAG: hypothetical protein K2X38_15805 [Gemmataceae bacterium]|nr:hypothetical protein [Gemmataceae bacterium]